MKISDRTIGVLSLCFGIALFIWISLTMWVQDKLALSRLTVYYEDVGSLQPQDPVSQRGVIIGRVGSIVYDDQTHKARVVLEFDQRIKLKNGTQFNNENYSLMGERMISVIPSDTGEYLSEAVPVNGVFQPGIAESMKQMDAIVGIVNVVTQSVNLLAKGDSKNPSLVEQVREFTAQAEHLLEVAQKTSDVLEPQIKNGLKQSIQLEKTSTLLMSHTQKTIDSLYVVSQSQLTQTQSALASVSHMISQLDQNVDGAEQNPLWKELSQKREILDNLVKFQASLFQLIRWVKISAGMIEPDYAKGENKVRILKFKNANFFGETAREKAKKRQQNKD